MPTRWTIPILCSICLLIPHVVSAEQRPPASKTRRAVWTVVGAAAGFTVGLCAGLRAFDDAIDSDRKIWTLSMASAAGGAAAAWYLARPRRPSVRPFARGTGIRTGTGIWTGTGIRMGTGVRMGTGMERARSDATWTGLFANPVPTAIPVPAAIPVPIAIPVPVSSHFIGE
jgi:hypothetical protein